MNTAATTTTTTTTKSSNNIVLKPKPALSPNTLPNPSYQAIVMLPLTTAGDALEDAPSKRFADATSSFWIGVEKKEREEHLLKSTWQTNKETKKDSIFDRFQKKKRKSGGDHRHGTESTNRSGGGGISQFLPTMRNGKLQHVKMQATTSNNTLVLFYDVDDGTNTSVLPDHVYHENGTKVHINDVLSNGLPIIMEHPPPPPGADSPPSDSTVFVASDATASSETSSGTSQSNNDSSSNNNDSSNNNNNTTTRSTAAVYNFQDNSNSNSNVQKKNVNPHDWENMPQAQDQMIIVSTVATMALLVGALSARRLRSRHFLSSCIENESLEDELAYDTAYTTTGGRGSGYDTFGGGGSSGGSALPWRGDLEKFDV